MPCIWDLKETAFVNNLEFSVHLETSPWTLANDTEDWGNEQVWGLSVFSMIEIAVMREMGGHDWLHCPKFGMSFSCRLSRVPGSIHWKQRGGEDCHQLYRVAAKPSAGQWLFHKVGVHREYRNRATLIFVDFFSFHAYSRAQGTRNCSLTKRSVRSVSSFTSCSFACYATHFITMPLSDSFTVMS